MDLILERKDQANETPTFGDGTGALAMMTPKLGGDYWAYRVVLSKHQAIVGFPKFFTIGIGFAEEEDWNTNLPFTCSAAEIFDHIKHNKGDEGIADADVLHAIELVQDAARTDGR